MQLYTYDEVSLHKSALRELSKGWKRFILEATGYEHFRLFLKIVPENIHDESE